MKIKTITEKETQSRHIHKYENKNPVHQFILGRFLDGIAMELAKLNSKDVLDVGCGEALFWKEMEARGSSPENLTGMDLRTDSLAMARDSFPQHLFLEQNFLTWETESKYDLVVASQVLEHLTNPKLFLKKLVTLSSSHLLLSVPWEPYFRLCNLIRGRDIFRLGNHPEHINLWGRTTFLDFIEPEVDIVKFTTFFPFLLAVAKPKRK